MQIKEQFIQNMADLVLSYKIVIDPNVGIQRLLMNKFQETDAIANYILWN